ncbi:pimeloyl-ACP methyl ester carboxylesterase [Inhella inkyongensis]|uniref:Pimeloyl-ACP methyl ester carboxylesterase n=1 Tax=Inhella inkyongensis TaxID=392593 RepID=A0A840S2G9_9BURK|nr:alpha/beta hydrolase [Inhella inkyongensis]MBB5202739.1 pimeloyl-ACP methyl ester carboxylesterase [Inhella inkyongensis]
MSEALKNGRHFHCAAHCATASADMGKDLDTWLARGHSWSWRGRRIFVAKGGQGAARLLLHGYPTGSFDWAPLWARLTQSGQVLAPDFLGLGFSDKPLHASYALGDHADMVLDLLQAHGVDEVSLVAHDLGVSVAQELLARIQEGACALRVRAVVLLNGGLCPQAYRPRWIQRLLASPLGGWIGPQLSRTAFERTVRGLFATPPEPDLLDDFWTLLEHQQGRQVAHRVGAFWRERLTLQERLLKPLLSPQCPPLRLVNGSADPNSGRHMADAFLRLRPDTDLVRLESVGHWPQWEAPEAVWAALGPFLTTHH